MGTKAQWIVGVLVVMAGASTWLAFRTGRETGAEPETVEVIPPAPVHASRASETPPTSERTEVLAGIEPPTSSAEVPPQAENAPAAPQDARSPLAKDLDDLAASFLTEQPRAADLLALVERMASLAEVEPDGVKIERNEEDDLISARGTLIVGDLRGGFLIDQDGYSIAFSTTLEDAPWFQRDLRISFQSGESGTSGCNATVQFHPNEPSTAELALDREKLVGWSVSTNLETGSLARPLTLSADGDAWMIGAASEVPLQEFPWISHTRAFDVWLRLLEPYATR